MSFDRTSAFKASRLTSSTFLIEEFDSDLYSEHPFIYAKLVPEARTILIIDTGCGGASASPAANGRVWSLREFVETVNIEDNGSRPLNEGGEYRYVVVTTHCHYDHILGVEQFKDSPILASSYSKSFLSPANIPTHSLCSSLGINTPSYTPTFVPHLASIHSIEPSESKTPPVALGVRVLHTPGHTPDQLALWDAAEGMLYVGDSLYEDAQIIFPKEGSIIDWLASMKELLSLVETHNGLDSSSKALLNAGHCTAVTPALEILEAALSFMEDVMGGTEPVRQRSEVRGEPTVHYAQESGRFSLRCPERLVLEAAKASGSGM